jgi:predicted GTPase
MSQRTRILILGAGGRDFQVFNTVYREDPRTEIVAFTATQIPGIEGRVYPPALSGDLYPQGIPVRPQTDLERIIRQERIEKAIFAYSDVSYDTIEEIRKRVEGAGATLELFDPDATMIQGEKPCVAVCAVRTGCGKSAVSRYVMKTLQDMGKTVAALRHPMPYGDLAKQAVQRFATLDDLKRHDCTIEEMEEYEPHIRAGNIVFAGADYAAILAEAEKEADVIVWDGGNNDTPFIRPNLWITLLDPLRPGDELRYFPGRWNLERADVLVVAKIDEAKPEDVAAVKRSAAERNPDAVVVDGHSPIELADPEAVREKRVLVVEDGPTTTHGGMGYGAGWIAARRAGAGTIVDPRPYAKGGIAEAFRKYPHLREVLPALGYGDAQLEDLRATIAAADADIVVIGTPIDLTRVVRIDKPTVRVTYGFREDGDAVLARRIRETFA